MNSKVLRKNGGRIFAALLPLLFGASDLLAVNIITTTAATVSCNTSSGPGTAGIITVKPTPVLTGVHATVVTFTAPGAGLVITPSSVTLNAANSVTGANFSVNVVAGCAGASSGATTIQFRTNLDGAGANNDATAVVTDTVVATASALSVAPVTISCARTAGGSPVFTPGPALNVSVTSAATGGTPFTVDTSGVPPPAWLTVTPTTGGTATATAVTFTVQAAAGCGAFAAGTNNTATLHLLNAPAPDRLVVITLQVVPPSALLASPSPASLTYVRGSGSPGYVDVRVTSAVSPAPFYSVSTASLPIWLTVDSTTGTVPKSIRFSSTSVCDTLAPGTYTATIYLKVSGYADLAVPVSLLVNNKAPRLSVAEGTTRTLSWTIGAALPTPIITAVSTDSPIAYTASTGGVLVPVVSAVQQSGLAYSFGTQIGVSFNPLSFAAAQPGNVLSGTVTLTWGSPASTIVVTFNVTILSPGAAVTGLTPASLPTSNSGQTFSVVLTGSGFVPSTDPAQRTKVGVVVGGTIVADTNIAANVVNASNIILTITVPAVADANLPFAVSGAGGSVVLGICNPSGATCGIPTGTATLTIGAGPIIQAVTSASAFVQVAPPALQSVAPYDMISIFGANFCSSGGTGCSSSQVLYGAQDPLTFRYGTTVSPDAVSATQRLLSVTFQTYPGGSAIATAPILFATNGQINIMAPSALTGNIGSTVAAVVNFGYGSGATLKSSAPLAVSVAATNPGIFTVGSNGQGDAAVLNSSWSLVGASNPAAMRSTGSDSDTVAIYLTGLGAPDGVANNASAGASFAWSADCITPASYLASLNAVAGSSLTNIDGTIIQSGLLNTNRLPPCVATGSADLPSVTIGGIAGTVVYAGFVPDTIAGLYQLNVTLPGTTPGSNFTTAAGASIATITQPVQLPVVITANSTASQTGVNMWVNPRLKVLPPSGAGLTGTVGIPWGASNNLVVASEGTAAYRYSLTLGLLPAGVTLNGTTGAISGTPAANTAGTYTVTVTATDSANVPVKGTVAFTLTVAGGLFVTSSGSSPFSYTFGTAHASVTTVTAAGGTFPYTYAITAPGSVPTGLTVSAGGVVGVTALTPGGTYPVTVTATDANSVTGSAGFSIVEALNLANGSITAGSVSSPVPIVTMTATGNTGTITWSLTSPPTGVSINGSTGVITNDGTASVQAGTVLTVVAADGTAAPGSSAVATGTRTVTISIGS